MKTSFTQDELKAETTKLSTELSLYARDYRKSPTPAKLQRYKAIQNRLAHLRTCMAQLQDLYGSPI